MPITRRQAEIDDLLAELPENAAFISTAGQACLALPGSQVFPLSSAYIRDFLTTRFFRRHGRLPSPAALNQVIACLRSTAHASPARRPAAIRAAAPNPSTIVIDLANSAGEFVEITPNGWQVSQFSEIAFLSTRGQLPLPHPETPSSELRTSNDLLSHPVINEWLLHALQPTGPYPILILHGPSGSGKTTLARMLRALIDPNTAPIQPLPSRSRAVFDVAVRDRVLVFDHVTRMSPSAADALCQISTGTGITIKESADPAREPLRLDLARPVILTTPRLGVHDWQPRPDLAARAIAVELPKIENPRPESELWSEFESALPALLATLYTSFSAQWNRSPDLCRHRSPDLCLSQMHTASCIHDPLFTRILTLGNWTGTASALITAISASLTARALSARLHQLQQTLSQHGITIEFHRLHAGVRQITITNQNLRHPTVVPAPTPRRPNLAIPAEDLSRPAIDVETRTGAREEAFRNPAPARSSR